MLSALSLTTAAGLNYHPVAIPNADFRDQLPNGRPNGWDCRDAAAAYQCGDRQITLAAANGKDVYLIMRQGKLKSGFSYKVSFQVKGQPGAAYRSYAEGSYRINGKEQYIGTDAVAREAPREWSSQEYIFNTGECVNGYLVFASVSGKEVSFRNLAVGAAELPQITALGGIWKTSGNSIAAPHGVVVKAGGGNLCRLAKIPVKDGRSYRFSCLAESAGRSDSGTGFNSFRVNSPGVDSAWDDVEIKKLKTLIFTARANRADLSFEVAGNAGSVRFSEFKLDPYQLDPSDNYVLTITSPAYRDAVYAGQAVKAVTGRIVADGRVGQAVVTFNGQTRKNTSFAREMVFDFPIPQLVDGNYSLAAELFDANGKLLKKWQRTITKLPPSQVEVIPFNRGYFSVNGKPFFPVLLWGGTPKELIPLFQAKNAFYYAARHGVNSVILEPKTAEEAIELLERVRCVGMMAVFALDCDNGNNPSGLMGKLRKILSPEVLKHPALLGYLSSDEPSWGGVPLEPLQKSYDCYRAVDPYRPVWINAAPRGEVAEHQLYNRPADIYGVDIYPIPYPNEHSGLEDKGVTSVGKYAERMYRAVDGRKPVWMVMQGFSWGDYQFAGKGDRYPTYTELRFMAYDSLMNHAAGLTWWGLHYAVDRQFIDALFQVTAEMRTMSTLFVKGRFDRKFAAADRKAIRTLTIEYQGARYLIAANATDKPVAATLRGNFGMLTEYPSNKSGKLTRTFAPFEVVAMGEKPLPEPLYALPPPEPEMEKLSQPFFDRAAHYSQLQPYPWKGGWIWERNSAGKAGAQIYLAKTFDLRPNPVDAKLYLAADDFAEAYLNGIKIGEATSWSIAAKFDCAKLLRPGRNVLYIAARDGGSLPCGVLGELVVNYSGGSPTVIPTDAGWQASSLPGNHAQELSGAAPALLVAPYGGGTWGSRVTVMGTDRK